MKVFEAYYYESWRFGNYESHKVIVVASTEDEAFGLVLESFGDSKPKHWSLTEVDLTYPHVSL